MAERVSTVEAKVDGLSEDYGVTKGTVESLSKIKVSGYVQGRFEWHDASIDGVDASGKPTNLDRFYVRRGRVKVTYADISHSKALVEIAVRKGSFVPEVSYGTHFFQELVEEGIFYLALYPDEPLCNCGDCLLKDCRTYTCGGAHHVTHALGALAVPLDARAPAALGPATVAVHDDGDVPRQM